MANRCVGFLDVDELTPQHMYTGRFLHLQILNRRPVPEKKNPQIGYHARPRQEFATAPLRTGADTWKTGSVAGKRSGSLQGRAGTGQQKPRQQQRGHDRSETQPATPHPRGSEQSMRAIASWDSKMTSAMTSCKPELTLLCRGHASLKPLRQGKPPNSAGICCSAPAHSDKH